MTTELLKITEMGKSKVPVLVQNLKTDTSMKLLIEKRYEAEKENEDPFAYFSDIDMIYYYVHEKKNIDSNKNRMDNTKEEYLRELLQFATNVVQYAEDIELDIVYIVEGSLFKSLKPRHIEKYQEWLHEKSAYIIGRNSSYSSATIARKTTIIKSFLSFIESSGYVKQSLSKRLKSATVSKDERPNKDLSPHEVIQLLDYFSKVETHPIIFGLIHFFVTTGVRNEELCNANVGDLSYDDIREEHYLLVNGKGNKKRYVPVKEKVLSSLNEFRIARGEQSIEYSPVDSPLFATSTGNRYSNSYLAQYLKKAILRADIPFVAKKKNPVTTHTFRHAFAIISYHQGVDVYTIMRSLGHEHIETTMIYLQKEFEKDKHAAHSWDKGLIKDYV